jgi:hypothetical protein
MKPLGIARILLDAKPGQAVRYRDGNPLNLQIENLYLVPDDRGRGHDRERIMRVKVLDADTMKEKRNIAEKWRPIKV